MSGTKIELTGDSLKPLADELRDLQGRGFARRVALVADEVERKIDREGIVDKLLGSGATPPARGLGSPKFVWSFDEKKNQRARRWFFANYPNGYRRTGQLEKNWRFNATAQNNAIEVTLENNANASSFVYGAPAFNYEQVPGHVTTGWANAGRVGQQIVLDAVIYAESRLSDIIDDAIERL